MMNEILRTLNKFAERNGWDDTTKISIMARFIEQFGDGSGEDMSVYACDCLGFEEEIETFNEFLEDMEDQKENLKSYLENGDKPMRVIKAEVYYGYYNGDTKMWDTVYVNIPDDTAEKDIERVAVNTFYAEYAELENVAFTGLFHWEYEDVDDDDIIDCDCDDCDGNCDCDEKEE